jgi:large subunit ribosomal protein L25
MAETRLSAEARDPHKMTNKALRRSGRVPGIYYARTGENKLLDFDARTVNNLMRREIALLHLELNGETLPCIIREVQRHPVLRDVWHVDLMGVVGGQMIRVHIPVHPIGTAKGIKEGGTLELVLRELDIECLPAELPTHIDIDVTNLGMNDGIRIDELKLAGIIIHGDPHRTVIHVIPPRIHETATATDAVAGAGAGEPEVIREKKKEDEPKKDDKKKDDKKK